MFLREGAKPKTLDPRSSLMRKTLTPVLGRDGDLGCPVCSRGQKRSEMHAAMCRERELGYQQVVMDTKVMV